MMVQLRVGSQGMFAAILMITVVGSLTKNLKEQYWDKKWYLFRTASDDVIVVPLYLFYC